MKKKYLFLMRTGEFGGAERFLIDYFRFIDFNRYSVAFGVNIDVFSHHFKKHGLPVELIDFPGLDIQEGFLAQFAKAYRFFKKVRPDGIVFNQFWLATFTLPEIFAAFLVTKGNAYMVVHDCPAAEGDKQKFSKTLQGYFARRTMAVSKATRESLVNGYRFPGNKVKMIYHGIDVDMNAASSDKRQRLRNELGIPAADYVIVSTAMLHPGKRVDRLIQAFADMAGERRDIRLLIVGSGAEQEKLLGMVDVLEEGIRKRVKFFGFREDIPAMLQLSDIFVLPSDSEGLPLACLEAMSCGLISVVTDCGGPREIIRDGHNGYLVEKSREGVVRGLRESLALSREENDKLSRNARAYIEENFDLKKNIFNGLQLLNIN
jgi:glycosyltransferase involved in cell wall biosynthesis